jgi:hypothetical protein
VEAVQQRPALAEVLPEVPPVKVLGVALALEVVLADAVTTKAVTELLRKAEAVLAEKVVEMMQNLQEVKI